MPQRNTRLTQEEFLSLCNEVWGEKFDLSKAIYVNNKTKVEIICPEHGSFFITPSNFRRYGCRKCGNISSGKARRKDTDYFIKRAKQVYGDKYDYSKVKYTTSRNRVEIICPKHGSFFPTASNFLHDYGCKHCGYEKNAQKARITKEKFILKSRCIHGYKYDYSLVEYKSINEKVKIICTIHGVFEQTPEIHLMGSGCQKCGKDTKAQKMKTTQTEFIEKAKRVHGELYDYSLVNYVNARVPVAIICKKHGVFKQMPYLHNQGRGCQECKKEYIGSLHRSNTSDFILKAKRVHGDKYDYSKVNYLTAYDKVEISCPKHGLFLQYPYTHLYGQGCPQCSNSTGEEKVASFLKQNKIKYKKEKTFKDCKDVGLLRFDFYLPELNTCIEYQGIQHYKIIERFGGEDEYKSRLHRDQIKRNYCKDNNIKLIEIKYNENIELKLKELSDM